MSGLAATRLVKRQPVLSSGAGRASTGRTLFNATNFLERKTDHAGYLHKTLFTVVAIAMSQLATIRPPSPFLWLGIYLLRHSGLCDSVTLHDGRVIVCDGTTEKAPARSRASTAEPAVKEEQSQEQEDDPDDGDESTQAAKDSDGDDSSNSSASDLDDSDDDNDKRQESAAVTLQSNFRRHKAQKDYHEQRKERQKSQHGTTAE